MATGSLPSPAAQPAASYTRGANLHFQAGMTQSDDGAWEDLQRQSGGYQAGQYEMMQDQLSAGSDSAGD
jgi:hypothetical protein